MVFKVASKINALFFHQFLQEPHIFIKSSDIFRILVMECLPFLWDENNIIIPCGADIGDTVVESATKEIARYGRPSMLSGEYNPEAVMSDFIREYIRYESVRKKRLTES